MSDHRTEPTLSHLNEHGDPSMVSIQGKSTTARSATATGSIRIPRALQKDFAQGDYVTSKGSVLHTAIIAGTQAVKKCSDLIPFCHPIPVEKIRFTHDYRSGSIFLSCEVGATYSTGVEMEALTGVSVALLTIYDMCKSAGHDMSMDEIQVIQKTGGKSDFAVSE